MNKDILLQTAYTFPNVGLSNKLDSELVGRKPVKRSHGVLAMAALDFAVMARGIRTADDARV